MPHGVCHHLPVYTGHQLGSVWANFTDDVEKMTTAAFSSENWKADATRDGLMTHCSSSEIPLYQAYPGYFPVAQYTEMELNYDGQSVASWMRLNMWIPFMVTTIYAMSILQGTVLMKNRKPFDLRVPLALWNFFLASFSWFGVFRTMPRMLVNLYMFGFKYTVCKPAFDSFGVGPSGFWATLFVFSKFPELIDTIFIVLRKKPLLFLHWYHHVTVLLFCWHAYATRTGSGLYFIAMNFTVHAVMYTYYGLKACEAILSTKPPPRAAKDASEHEKAEAKKAEKKWRKDGKVNLWPSFIPIWMITIMQLSQMVVGTGVCIAAIYFKFSQGLDADYADTEDGKCGVDTSNLFAGSAMYFSYFLLFLNFFINRFCDTSKSPAKKQKLCGEAKDICGMSPDADTNGTDYQLQAARATSQAIKKGN
tara:strand:+ start:1551 stop:2810 length:1260 start_codon:yes stop_codon:yes gene_type:complete